MEHFRQGIATRDEDWLPDPALLGGTKALSAQLEEQIQRHEQVLPHAFIAEAYAFMRNERINRNMYLDDRAHYDEDSWRETSLGSLVNAVLILWDAYEPVAERYLGDPSVSLSQEEIDSMRNIHRWRREAKRDTEA
jgi:hypothetical protein